MATASDIHFNLNEKIEKVRPKRNGDGDIKKCIDYCEKGMSNLKDAIVEWESEYEINAIPPSIPCRDQLIRCYLMIAKYDEAESVVMRSQQYGAWDGKQSESEILFIKKVKTAHIAVLDRIKNYPGSLQADFYKVFPHIDKDAMKWFFANSTLLIKRKHKNTYSLWLEEQDIPEEKVLQENAVVLLNQKQIQTVENQVDIDKFPDWYVSISFGQSTSKNYSKALMLAKQAAQYIESEDEYGNLIHQAVYSSVPSEYLSFITLYELVNVWKSSFTIVNGQVMDRKIIGGLNYCYGDNIRSGNPDFCYGASQFTTNPFGCHRLQISSHNNPWWSFGHFDMQGIWIIDKEAIKERISMYSTPYLSCPAFSYKRILDGLNSLPDFIDPRVNHEWIVLGTSIAPNVRYSENENNLIQNVNSIESKSQIKKSGCLTTIVSATVFLVTMISFFNVL